VATFSGVEALLIGWTADQLGVRCLTDLPADLASAAPIVQIVRIGGPSDDSFSNFQAATVSVDCFAADRLAATTLAQQLDDAWRKVLPGAAVSGAVVGKVRTLTGASWRPWDDTAVRRVGATYQVWVKAPA